MEDRCDDVPSRGHRNHGHRSVLLQLRGDHVLRRRPADVFIVPTAAAGTVQRRGQRAEPGQVGGGLVGAAYVQAVRRV